MLSAFRKCRQCYGPSYLHATWLNPDYFNNATITVRTDDASAIGGFTFSNINKAQAQLVKSMERDLQFTLEGVIGGLSSGQIALHESGNLLKKCRATSQEQEHAYPITLKMINASTHESLAILNMFWER